MDRGGSSLRDSADRVALFPYQHPCVRCGCGLSIVERVWLELNNRARRLAVRDRRRDLQALRQS